MFAVGKILKIEGCVLEFEPPVHLRFEQGAADYGVDVRRAEMHPVAIQVVVFPEGDVRAGRIRANRYIPGHLGPLFGQQWIFRNEALGLHSQMGGQCVYLSKDDVGLGTREPEEDIARVLDRWVDGIIARVYSHRSLKILSEHTSIPV